MSETVQYNLMGLMVAKTDLEKCYLISCNLCSANMFASSITDSVFQNILVNNNTEFHLVDTSKAAKFQVIHSKYR